MKPKTSGNLLGCIRPKDRVALCGVEHLECWTYHSRIGRKLAHIRSLCHAGKECVALTNKVLFKRFKLPHALLVHSYDLV